MGVMLLTRFVSARFIATGETSGLLLGLRLRRRHFATRRLDATQGAAKLFNLALVRQLLTLSHLYQFQNLVQLINHVLQRLGNFRGVRNGLMDGGGFSRPEISRLDPGFGALRLGALRLRTALRIRAALGLNPGFRSSGLGSRLGCGFRLGFGVRRIHRAGFV